MVSSPSRRPDRRATRRAATRKALIQAGLRLFARKGTDATTFQQIADEANVGFGSVFNHFASKAELRDAALADMMITFAAVFERLATQITDPAERLAAFVRITIKTALRDPDWGWFLVRTSVETPLFRVVVVEQISGVVRQVWRRRTINRQRVEAVAIAAGGVILASITSRLTGQLDEDVAEYAAGAVLRLADVPPRTADQVARRPLPDDTTAPATAPRRRTARARRTR
jgi:AcrR family transcriptional regulator